MTVHAGFLGLGSLEDLWDDEFPGFEYPARKTELKLIGNGVDAANVVIQESAKGYREAVLGFTAESATDRDTVRGYEESSTVVAFTDYDGTTCDVLVFDFSASPLVSDLWRVTVHLVQLTEPVGP